MDSTSKLGKILIIIIAFLIFTSIPMTVYLVKRRQEIRKGAEPATSLSFEPDVVSVDKDEIFSLDLMIDTASNTISSAEVQVVFDSTKLEGISLINGTFMPNEIVPGNIVAGLATITLGSDPGKSLSGKGNLATITFKALEPTDTPVTITLGENSRIPDVNEERDVLANKGISSADVKTGSTVTPTATASPVPTATSTTQPGAPTTPPGVPTATSLPTATVTQSSGDKGGAGSTIPTNTPTTRPVAPTPTPAMPDSGFALPTVFLVLLGFLSLGLGSLAILR